MTLQQPRCPEEKQNRTATQSKAEAKQGKAGQGKAARGPPSAPECPQGGAGGGVVAECPPRGAGGGVVARGPQYRNLPAHEVGRQPDAKFRFRNGGLA